MNDVLATGLIVNPRARAVRRRFYRRNRFWERLLPRELVRITGNDDELRAALEEFRCQGVRVLATLGGDGTMSHVYNHLPESWGNEAPWLLPLPAGTLNAVPRSLGLSGSPERLLRRHLELARLGRPPRLLRRRVLAVRDHRLGKTIWAFSFLTGFLFRSMEQYYGNPAPGPRDIWRAGVLPIFWVFWPTRAGREYFRPVPARVTIDGQPFPHERINAVVLSTFDKLVLWYSPFPQALDGRPAFQCLVNAMPRRELARHVAALVRGRYRGPGHFTGQAARVEIETEIGYVVDGEMYHRQSGRRYRVSVALGPELEFVQP